MGEPGGASRPFLWVIAGLLLAIVALWSWSPIASLSDAAALVVAAIIAVLRRSLARMPSATPPLDDEAAELQARLFVTKMLGNLTRVQVAYLAQTFSSPAEARAWLKRALPRSYRPVLDQLHRDLETARLGTPPPGTKLATRIIALGKEIERIDEALTAAKEGRPTYAVARPVAYVITEGIDGQHGEPLVVTLASFDPSQPTLLPSVDAINVFTEEEGQKRIHGQVDFDSARRALGQHLTAVDADDDAVTVYATEPIADTAEIDSRLARPPLGFVVGASELV